VTLHPQAIAALAAWSVGPSCADAGFGAEDIAAMRASSLAEAAAESKEPVDRVEDVDADGVACRLYVPSGARRCLVFLHGGGFVFGDVETHDGQARRLANRSGSAVLAVDYRCAPEHRFPAAPDDVDTALSWLARHAVGYGLDPAQLVTVGDSAGGNLALVAALRAPGRVAATVLVYPFLDPGLTGASYASTTGGLSTEESAWYWQQYAATARDLADPDLAPLRSERLGELPPTFVQIASEDVLADEDRSLARLALEAGATVEVTTYAGMIHGFWRHPELFDDAEVALADMVDFLDRHVPSAV
jgi:acetyl esterase